MSRRDLSGWPALLAGVGLFSTVEVASKIIGNRVPPFQMVFLRFFLTGLILLALALPALRRRPAPLAGRDLGAFALMGLVGVAAAISFFHLALLVLDKAASCAIVFSANPVFVVLFARFINAEAWTARKLAALALGATGVACFAWESGTFTARSLAGLGLMVAAALCFALNICMSRRVIARYGVFLLMGASALAGSLLVLPFAIASVARHGSGGLASAWAPLLYVVLAGTALAYALYYYGLSRSTAFQASMTFFLKPALASLLAFLLLGERLNGFMLAGSLLILSGLLITAVPGLRLRPASSQQRFTASES